MYRKWIVKLPPNARFSTVCLHAGQEPDPVDRRDHHADLPDLDLRPGRARQAQGLRVRPHAEPDARGARAQPRGDRRRQRRRSPLRRAWRPSAPIATMLKSGDHVVVSDNIYGGTFRLFDKVLSRYQLSFSYVDTSRARRGRAGDHADDADAVRRDADQPDPALTDLARGGGARAPARCAAGRRQHVREPVRAAADRVRRRSRHPQHDQVPERPQRQHRRRRRSPCATRTSSG